MHANNYIDYPILIKEGFDIPICFTESPARQKSLRDAKKITTLDKAGQL